MTNKLISISINNNNVQADPNKTILATARENNIHIPTLCHDDRLKPIGSCLLCVVAIEGQNKLALACTTKPADGMKITTHNEKISTSRKQALELLLSNHYADCRGPCFDNCPAHVDVQGYLALAHEGKYEEAINLIRQNNPLPSVCGRVCVRYCEAACRRQLVDDPVGVNFVKRTLADLSRKQLPSPQTEPQTGKRVAIVGGGPAGLTAAYYLAKKGHAITIFESHPKLGGMLRYGIPDYRLPQEVLDAEIAWIVSHGVDVRVKQKLGRDFSLASLKNENYQAIFLALGAQVAKKMGITNDGAQGVLGGIEFLEQVKKGVLASLKGHVVVVGGGNTAVDAARTALRCGASKVSIVYRRSLKEMPADPIEIKDACEEGVDIQFLTAPLKVVLKDKVPTALRCQKMELGPPDESGRRRPVAVKGSDFDLACDHIISAIGQDCDVSSVTTDDDLRIETTKWRTICTNPRTGATNVPGIFSAGDVVSGPKAAIDAIGQARDVANVIDHYLKSGELIDIPWEFLSQKNKLDTLTPAQFEQFPKVARAHLRQNDPATRVKTYDEVDHALTENETKCESARCLSCGCSAVFTCDLKKVATDYRVDQKKYAGKVNKFRVDATHPHIVLDPNKCIVCGKCVRLCDEVLGIGALGYVRRGFEMVVKPALEKPLAETNCTSCGNCVEICPTGALSLKMPCTQPGPFKTTTYDSVCSLCGSNCALVYHKVNDDIWTVGGKPINQYTQGLICQRGRFGQHNALRTNRLTSARRTQQGKTAPCSMDEAINALAQGLLTTHKTQGPEAMGFLISPTATNEVTYLFQKLAREVFLSNQVSSLSDLTQDHIIPQLIDSLGMTGSALTPNDLDQTHVIVLMNSDITEDSPVLSYSVKQAVRNGAKLISLSSANFDINKQASLWLNTRKGSHATLLQTVCGELIRQNKHDINYLKANTIGWETFCQNQTLSIETAVQECGVTREQIRVLIDLLGNSEANIAFLFNPYSPSDGTPDDLGIIINYLMLTGRSSKASNGLMLVHEHGNRQGHINYGGYVEVYAHNAHVAKQNGLQGVKTSSELRDKLLSNQIKSLFVWDEDVASEPELAAIFKNTPFTATVTPHDSPTAKMAKLVLPGTLPAESEGTLTDQYRCQRPFTRVFAPPSGLTGFEILSRVYAQTANREVPTLTQIREEMALFVKGLMRPEKMKFVLLES